MARYGTAITLLACAFIALGAQAASAATINGTIPAGAAAAGTAPATIVVRAVDPETGRWVAGTKLAAPGAFSLDVPDGLYLVVATASDPKRGEYFRAATRAFRLAAADSAATPKLRTASKRKKKCRKPPPRCKRAGNGRTKACRKAKAKYRKCRKAQRRKARASAAGRPAIGVTEWTVDVAGYGELKLWPLMVTSIGQSCIQDEMDHVAAAASDIAMLEAEIELQQSEYVDPSTRVDPSKRIHATHHVVGEGSFDAQGNGTLTVRVVTVGGTEVTSVTVSGHIFDVTDVAAQKLGEVLCKQKLRVQFTGERRNRWQQYDCDNTGFNNYDGSFSYDTPEEKRFPFPMADGDVNLPGTYSYQSESDAGADSGGGPTSDWLNFTAAGGGAYEFWLEALSFNPGGHVGFTATRETLMAGPTTWPVNVTWNQTEPFHECTVHFEGYVTGTFTVTPTAPVELLPG